MKLSVLLNEISDYTLLGDVNVEVVDISADSRVVGPRGLYVAVCGLTNDGHKFIPAAIDNGASVIVAEQAPKEIPAGVTYVLVKDSCSILGKLASAFYGHPSRKMKVVGVTGTDGKTTTATLLHRIARAHGFKAGLLSTIQNVIVDEPVPTTHTTLDAVSLQGILAQMAAAGCEYVFMEVSSHSVVQNRIAGVTFAGGIFTNLTNCHLDYHRTMDSYFAAKQQFFNTLPPSAFALANVDDAHGARILKNTYATPVTYALNQVADYRGSVVYNALSGLEMIVNQTSIQTGLVGRFNAYNVAAAFAASQLLGFDIGRTIDAFALITPVEGRFDWIQGPENRIGVVDYANTPHALTNLLHTAREILPDRRVVVVIGCQGYPHDSSKRPTMGRIAAEADCAIFTTINPRWEPTDRIFEAMLGGVPLERRHVVQVIPDRAHAIQAACDLALPDGVVLVVGRGHVRYHQVRNTKEPFYDKDVLREAFEREPARVYGIA